jgi:hypothetical protein
MEEMEEGGEDLGIQLREGEREGEERGGGERVRREGEREGEE